jgi:hypothetical protein
MAPTSAGIPLPVQSRPERLPLNDPEFTWARFEAFCRDLIARLPGVTETQIYGQPGDDQQGIDIVAVMQDGTKRAYQCRQRKRFTKVHAQKAIAETEYPADEYVIVTSCEVGAGVRDACTQAPSKWSCWDVRDISQKVRELSSDAARSVVETSLGADWRKAFLGLQVPSAFVAASDFFAPWESTTKLFNHGWKLVGRLGVVDALTATVHSTEVRAVIMPGRGGIGKSKVLRSFAETFEQTDDHIALRFLLDAGANLSPEALDDLPPDECLVVIDDAHRREDLSAVFQVASRRQSPIHIVLATRPHAVQGLKSSLLEAGFDASQIVVLDELNELSFDDVVALSRQALGSELSHHADALASATKDCPLVTVIGGRLLAERKILPHVLEQDTTFRDVVLSRFQETLLGELDPHLSSRDCRRILDLLSLVGPFRENNSSLVAASCEFVELSQPEFTNALQILEGAGILLRRGYSLRIGPDVLADHILAKVCLTSHGQPTGYADTVFGRFSNICPNHILRNLAELDWRVRTATGNATTLLDGMFTDIKKAFEEAPNSHRTIVLDLVKEAATYQPQLILPLVQIAMRGPSKTPESPEANRYHTWNHADVLRTLPPLLFRVAINLEYLPYAATALWDLAKDDARPTDQLTEHPLRLLQQLAEFGLNKPYEYTRQMIEVVATILSKPDAHAHCQSPLDILDKVLVKEVRPIRSRGYQIIWQRIPIQYDQVRDIRRRAISLLAEALTHCDLRVQARAITKLDHALSEAELPHKEGRINQWEEEQLHIIALLAEATKNENVMVQRLIRNALTWEAYQSPWPSIKKAASAVINGIAPTFDYRLVSAFISHGGIDFEAPEGENISRAFDRHIAEQRVQIHRLAAEFVTAYPTPAAGVQVLTKYLGAMKTAGISPAPWQLLDDIVSTDIAYAEGMVRSIIASTEMALLEYLPRIIAHVRLADCPTSIELAELMHQCHDPKVDEQVAQFYAMFPWPNYDQGDVDIITSLVGHPQSGIRSLAIQGFGHLIKIDPPKALSLLNHVEVGDDVEVARALCMAYAPPIADGHGWVIDDELGLEVMGKLTKVSSIDDYHITLFLSELAKRHSLRIIQFLIGRIEGTTTHEFEPLPFLEFPDAFPIEHHHRTVSLVLTPAERKQALCDIRNRYPGVHWALTYYLPSLFREVAAGFDEVTLDVLNEWINSGDAALIERASGLLHQAPPNFIFQQKPYAANLLQQAFAQGAECYSIACSALVACTFNGDYSGRPGEPNPKGVYIRDSAKGAMDASLPGSLEHQFYADVYKDAQARIKDQLAHDEELDE